MPFPFQYINRIEEIEKIKAKGTTVEECLNIDVLFDAMASRAAILIKQTGEGIATSTAPAKVTDNELFAQQKMKMVRAHMTYLNYYVYREYVVKHQFTDARIPDILIDLVKICSLKSLLDDPGAAFDSGYFAPSAWRNMNAALDLLIKKIRPQILPLGEIKNYPDTMVMSNIGNYWGDIYE